MKKTKAQFRADVYAAMVKVLPDVVKAHSKGFEGPAKDMLETWQGEIDHELKARVRREAQRLEKIAKSEAAATEPE